MTKAQFRKQLAERFKRFKEEVVKEHELLLNSESLVDDRFFAKKGDEVVSKALFYAAVQKAGFSIKPVSATGKEIYKKALKV